MDSPPLLQQEENMETLSQKVREEEEKERLGEEGSDVLYTSTANPHNRKNIDLHRNRFRRENEYKEEHFKELYEKNDWVDTNHVKLEELPVQKFFIDPLIQKILYKLQVDVVDKAYNSFGKTEGSWDGYTLMFRSGWSPGDCRKPITKIFQNYCEEVYCPLIFCFLFGARGWEELKEHWTSFKSCTIKVCDSDTNFLGDNIFHMHIDGKIGWKQKNNHTQKCMSRLLFSIVTDTLKEGVDSTLGEYGTTVYPIWQPSRGFRSNQQFHAYMQSRYEECGLGNSGLPRPHYVMPEDLVYRAQSGEVLYHFSHAGEGTGPQAIHSEPNPCPDRHLYVFDWKNLLRKDENGKNLPSVEIPEDTIIQHLEVLSTFGTQQLKERFDDVITRAGELMPIAEQYPGGVEALETVVKDLTTALQ
jgi:hypothetical protein